MSTLTDALNRIMHWLEQNRPNYAATFLPGLTDEEIQQKLSNLQFQLPEEIYELYRWRNGSQDEDNGSIVYPSFGFMPLDEALGYYEDFIDGSIQDLCNEGYNDISHQLSEHEANSYHHNLYFHIIAPTAHSVLFF